jgi:hypothetical protein
MKDDKNSETSQKINIGNVASLHERQQEQDLKRKLGSVKKKII